MTVSLAESGWAATCEASSKAMGGGSADRMEMSESVPGMAMPATDQNPHDCAPGHSDDSRPQQDAGPEADLRLVTDARGIASLKLSNAGWWNIRTAHAASKSAGTDGEWAMMWATLVFGTAPPR